MVCGLTGRWWPRCWTSYRAEQSRNPRAAMACDDLPWGEEVVRPTSEENAPFADTNTARGAPAPGTLSMNTGGPARRAMMGERSKEDRWM